MRLIAISYITLFLSLSICACSQTTGEQQAIPQQKEAVIVPQPAATIEVPVGAQALMDNYPDFVKGYENNHLLLADGSTILYDDLKEKSFIERMDKPDVEDMFSQPYDTSVWSPTRNYDPGRVRNEELLKYMYGKNEAKARKGLVRVKWFKQQILFSGANGAADSLAAVAKELTELPASFQKYFDNSSTFYWRTVRGSKRLSAHSFGIAIDICTKFSDYWRWKNPGKGEEDSLKYTNRIPKEIIQIFEKHGFISGARWYHFDTMHFEFRPDLLQASRHHTNN